MFRQGVISIFKPNDSGGFNEVADKNIVFRQPFHSFGLGYTFSFDKSLHAPITDCQLLIINPGDDISQSLDYEYSLSKKRPLIRIYGGYSDFVMRSFSEGEISTLKGTLDQVYTGYPYFYSDDKVQGGRELSLELTDTSLIGSNERISIRFSEKTSIIDIITKLIDGIADGLVESDTSALEDNIDFSFLETEFPVLYNNRIVLEDIIPDLARQYAFTYFADNEGTLVFRPREDQGKTTGASVNKINNNNGLAGFANTVNWVDIGFKTYFGKPQVFYPGDRVSIDAPNLYPKTAENELVLDVPTNGLIVNASYQWDDDSAEINYVMNKFGQEASANPIVKV